MPVAAPVQGGGERLRKARARRRMNQTMLGQLIRTPDHPEGVSQVTVSAWEKGDRKPTLDQCDAIAAAVGVNWKTVRLWWEPQRADHAGGTTGRVNGHFRHALPRASTTTLPRYQHQRDAA